MANIYGPILPLQLDSRNTLALVRAMQTRIFLESGGELNDFTPASPLSAIVEGQAFAGSELLYYLNNLPEAFTLQWLKQLGIQRRIGARAYVEVTFTKLPGFSRVLIIPKGTKLYALDGLTFETLSEVRVGSAEFTATVSCRSLKWGSQYNVSEGTITKIERNFAGLESLRNNIPATGGLDLETIDEMKSRAFEVISRRTLTLANDFTNEVQTLVPDASLVKTLTYEERFELNESLSGNVVIVAGTETGEPLSNTNTKLVLDSIRPRVTIGTNVSIVSPNVVPVDAVVEVYYDPRSVANSTDFYANQIYSIVNEYLSPGSLGLGAKLNYQTLSRRLYELDFIDSINQLDMRIMIPDNTVLDGICAGFSGEESNDGSKCFYNYSSIVNYDNQTLSGDPITSYKLYRAQITLTSNIDFTPLTYSYDELY